jgi:NAD(P)-dependent dehydrogenase (short-subunit alcohol dehydrogenase family)
MDYPAFDLKSKTAVLIGGTSGIGLALAEGLARAGADVVATGRRAHLVQCAADKIKKLGRKTCVITCDVTDRASLENLEQRVHAEFAHVDILVNCAGVTSRIPSLEITERDWKHILDINLMGILRACQIFGRGMVDRKYGRIINIASLSSFVAFFEVAAYTASKAAVAALTKSLAVEWATSGVCVNALAPGVFQTDLNAELLNGTPRSKELLLRTPMRRFGRAEELVGACVFLASDAASFVTGHVLTVDGGFLASGVNQ